MCLRAVTNHIVFLLPYKVRTMCFVCCFLFIALLVIWYISISLFEFNLIVFFPSDIVVLRPSVSCYRKRRNLRRLRGSPMRSCAASCRSSWHDLKKIKPPQITPRSGKLFTVYEGMRVCVHVRGHMKKYTVCVLVIIYEVASILSWFEVLSNENVIVKEMRGMVALISWQYVNVASTKNNMFFSSSISGSR